MADSPVLLITGASSGLADLANELGGPERALAQRCDVTRFEEQEALVASALERFGRLDASFANAGFGAKRGFLEESVEHWRSMVDTNVYGAALSIRAALPHFRETGRGHMLLTGSVAGRRALPGSLYSATKWAVTAMGEALRQEVSESDIKVTLIEPGAVDTPFFSDRPSAALEADDIARTVMYALSQPPHVDVNEVLVRPVRQPT
jgi:NADP-dependent 3-hydroxy acid dehydrogenase YdfG